MSVDKSVSSVSVALASYNGAHFIDELLDSIICQEKVDLELIVSDDNSTDATCEIVKLIAPQALMVKNPQTGVLRNFENALSLCTAQYIALADQDDTWDHHKLYVMLSRIREIESEIGEITPILLFCDLEIVDQDLQMIHRSFFSSTRKLCDAKKFQDFLLGNHVPGCAMFFNRRLLEMALPFPDVDIHDHWLIQVAALLGRVEYIDKCLVKYRQHGGNAIGLGASPSGRNWLDLSFHALKALFNRPKIWRRRGRNLVNSLIALNKRFGASSLVSDQDRKILDFTKRRGQYSKFFKRISEGRTGERFLDEIGISYFTWKILGRSGRS